MNGDTLKSKSSNWFKIRKTPKKCSENDLLGLISELYSLSKSNKDFLEAGFLRENQILERYKSLIKKYLAQNESWKNGQQISIKDAKKVLNDYKKATSNKIGLIDLMVYYTECGTDFLYKSGDMYEQYYLSLESVFDNALKLMKQFPIEEVEDFIESLRKVVRKADHKGWGYHDAISDVLNQAYRDLP